MSRNATIAAIDAFTDGVRRVSAAWKLVLLLYFVAFAGIPSAFEPGPAGFAFLFAVLADAGSSLASVAAALAFACAGAFVTGGVLDRLARRRPAGAAAFVAAGRHHFWPLVRLGMLTGAAFWILSGGPSSEGVGIAGAPPLGPADDLAAFAQQALVFLGVAAVGVLVDYARVRTVVEDRRSATGALLASFRFVRRHPGAVAGLWLLNATLAVLVLNGCAFLATPAAAGGAPPGILLVTAACSGARLFLILVAHAAQTAYFQRCLARPGYVARDRAAPARAQL